MTIEAFGRTADAAIDSFRFLLLVNYKDYSVTLDEKGFLYVTKTKKDDDDDDDNNYFLQLDKMRETFDKEGKVEFYQ